MTTFIMPSSVPTFKAALRTRLDEDATVVAAKAKVFRGLPGQKAWPMRTVIVGQMSNRTLRYVHSMTQAREEYDVIVDVVCSGPPSNPYSTYEDYAYALANVVQQSVTDWTKDAGALVSGTWGQVVAAVPTIESDTEYCGLDARECTVRVNVHVTASLTGTEV